MYRDATFSFFFFFFFSFSFFSSFLLFLEKLSWGSVRECKKAKIVARWRFLGYVYNELPPATTGRTLVCKFDGSFVFFVIICYVLSRLFAQVDTHSLT